MIITILIVLAAGLMWSGVLFEHRRVLTFLATAGLLFEAQWLALTLLARTMFVGASAGAVYLFGGLVFLAGSVMFYRTWKHPYRVPGSGRRDVVIVPVLLIVLAAAWLISWRNGFMGTDWVSHGFYNGDTATLAALVQKSFLTDGLVAHNPFAGNGYLEYPTLLHGALAGVLTEAGAATDWLRLLPTLVYLQIFMTVPVFWLVWDVVFPEPANRAEKWFGIPSQMLIYWLQSGLVLYVLALSWDGYVYPQSHFWLTGLFVLLAALLVKGWRAAVRDWLGLAAGLVITLVLMISNAVTGTAALALTSIWLLGRASDTKRSPVERGAQLAMVLGLGAIFVLALPGDGALSLVPQFSYTAAMDMLRLALPLGLLGVGIYQFAGRQAFLASAASVLVGLGCIVFFFSSRNIVIDNASRFFYHAILAAFPLVFGPLIQLYYLVRRELLYSSHSAVERASGWALVLGLVCLLVLPAGASVASAHDNLMFKDEQTVSSAMRNVLWWIEESTPAEAVFIASPQAPFAIPMFTGRAVLRTQYWLSPDDAVLADVQAAFAGNLASQEAVVGEGSADFLMLSAKDADLWPDLSELYRPVLRTGAFTIYDISQ